jgi:hypothetical protein
MDGGFYTFSVLAVTSANTAAVLQNPSNNQIAGLRSLRAAFAKATINNNATMGMNLNVTNITICAVTPCLKTYNVSVYEGTPTSKVVNTWQFESWTYNGTTNQIDFARPPVDVVKGTTNTAFTIDGNTGLGFVNLLQQAFNGTATLPETDADTPKSYSSDTMQALYMIDDLGQMMENVASSLSSYMRTVSSEVVHGKVWAMKSYVHVRWIWLLLPMALMPASLAFLSTAIWTSRSRDLGVWKSSSFATLFHGLEDTLDAHDLRRRSNMEETSKTIVARLQLTDENTQKLVVNANNTRRLPSDAVMLSTKYKDKPCTSQSDSSSQLLVSDPGPFQIARRPVGSK